MPPFKNLSQPNSGATKPLPGDHMPEPFDKDVWQHSRDEGESVLDANTEMRVPDRNMGSRVPKEMGTNRGENHPQVPVYPEANPWGPAQTSKPFRVK
jgi:hypothetical protein